MTQSKFDLIVLGTGPAGSTVAKQAAKDGHRVAIVESQQFGGTCALRGCNPKKVYVNAGALVDQVKSADGKLVVDCGTGIAWPDLLQFKEEFTTPIPRKSKRSFEDQGMATFAGVSKFVGPTEISVGDTNLSADRILVATGAKPRPLPIANHQWITTSDELMELSTIPDRVVFVGGGYVSMEFSRMSSIVVLMRSTSSKRMREYLAGSIPICLNS